MADFPHKTGMRRSSVLLSVATASLPLAACVAPSQPAVPSAPPVAVPAPAPAPAPAPPPRSADWRDWPLTPGTWSYRGERHGSSASYGPFVIGCDRQSRQISLWRHGAAPGPLTVRTSSVTRSLSTRPATGEPGVVATLPASDALIDAMGYSRGRIVIEGGGAPALVVPAWAEILRVAEDCRG